jgi:hypothetical protein
MRARVNLAYLPSIPSQRSSCGAVDIDTSSASVP